jgi:hypothetical protein
MIDGKIGDRFSEAYIARTFAKVHAIDTCLASIHAKLFKMQLERDNLAIMTDVEIIKIE